MDELWKGIAIAGIWLTCALVCWIIVWGAVAITEKVGKIDGSTNLALLFILAFIATWIIANAK